MKTLTFVAAFVVVGLAAGQIATLNLQVSNAFVEKPSSYADGFNQAVDDCTSGHLNYVDPAHSEPYKRGYSDGWNSSKCRGTSFGPSSSCRLTFSNGYYVYETPDGSSCKPSSSGGFSFIPCRMMRDDQGFYRWQTSDGFPCNPPQLNPSIQFQAIPSSNMTASPSSNMTASPSSNMTASPSP